MIETYEWIYGGQCTIADPCTLPWLSGGGFYLYWLTIRWNLVQFAGSFYTLDQYYPHASDVIYVIFHNKKKNPIDVKCFSRNKNYTPYLIFFIVRKKSKTCACKTTGIITLYGRMCLGYVQKCKITTFKYW